MNKVYLFLKRHIVRITLSLVITALFLTNALGVVDLGFVQRVENGIYDLRLKKTMPNRLDPRIVIVDIDEKSLQRQGHWPWSRNKLAHMVNLLFDQYKIDVLGFDIVFAERDESSGLNNLDELARTELNSDLKFQSTLKKIRPNLRYDQIFAESLNNRRVVLGFYFHHSDKETSSVGALPLPSLERERFNPNSVGAIWASGYTANLPELQDSAMGGGFFNVSPLVDADGLFRRISLLQMYDGALYETLGLAVARLALREKRIDIGDKGGDSSILSDSVWLGKRRIPIDSDAAVLIPYRGKQGSFPYVSATDVLQGKVPPEILNGKIVLVGTTAPGLMDLRATPVQDVYPGVEAHASLVSGIIDGNLKEHSIYADGLEIIFLLLIGITLTFVLPGLSPIWATATSVGLIATLTVSSLYVWKYENLTFPVASVLLMMAILYILNMSYGYFIESRGKRLLAGIFGQYVPPELVDEMAKNPGTFTLEGKSQEMTVLFSDVRGFTSISEGLDPKQLTNLMNEYLTSMTQVIHQHRGTIDKYMGDAIMAFWGAPLADDQHTHNALLTARGMIGAVKVLQDNFLAKGWPLIKVGIGLNTGTMTVGNMGSEFRMAYTVMGDSVNLGSRLEGLTKEYGVDIIVSEWTMPAMTDVLYRELDCVRVKGKDKPVRIYEPIFLEDRDQVMIKEELLRYQEALTAYRRQDWMTAWNIMTDLHKTYPDTVLYGLYCKRIVFFREHAPAADWDGSFTFTTK